MCVCVCVWRVSNNRNLSIPLTFFNAIFGKRGGPTGCLLRQKFPSLPRTTFSMCILLKVVSTVPSQSFFFVCVIVGSYFGWSREREREDHRITGSLLLSVHKRNTGRANEIAKNDGDCTKDLEGYILNSCLCGTTIGCETSLGNGQIESSKCQFLQRFLLSPIKSLRFLCLFSPPTNSKMGSKKRQQRRQQPQPQWPSVWLLLFLVALCFPTIDARNGSNERDKEQEQRVRHKTDHEGVCVSRA